MDLKAVVGTRVEEPRANLGHLPVFAFGQGDFDKVHVGHDRLAAQAGVL